VLLPDRLVTNLCFGGPDMRTVFVTLSDSGRPIAIDDWPLPGLKLKCNA
jgi:gluconolactonase